MIDIQKEMELHDQWQLAWREILGEPTDDMPDDIDCDFDLHIKIWELELSKQKECFSLFPNGLKMLERANAVRAIEPTIQAIGDDELLGHIEKINQHVEIVLAKSELRSGIEWNENREACTKRSVYRGNRNQCKEHLNTAAPLTGPIDDNMFELFEKHFGVEGYAACGFLSQPFYKTTNYVSIQYSIFWAALSDEYEADPYQPVIELFKAKAQAGGNINDKEMLVVIEQ